MIAAVIATVLLSCGTAGKATCLNARGPHLPPTDATADVTINKFVMYATFTWNNPDSPVLVGVFSTYGDCDGLRKVMFRDIPTTTILTCKAVLDFTKRNRP